MLTTRLHNEHWKSVALQIDGHVSYPKFYLSDFSQTFVKISNL